MRWSPAALLPRSLSPRTRDAVLSATRIVLAATASWLIAARGLSNNLPVLAPIAAVLTVQGTVYATVRQGIQVCAGVMVGAILGIGMGLLTGAQWWSIAAATAIGVAARYVPGLGGGAANQIPITALLVVSLGEGYGYARLVDTALGGAVGVLVTLVVIPPVRVPESAGSIGDVASDMTKILRDMADGLGGEWDREAARDWLHRARRLEDSLGRARSSLQEAEQSLRWNPRRVGKELTRLPEAAAALDHAAGQVRAIARGLTDVAGDLDADGHRLLSALPPAFSCAAAALDAFRRQLTDPADASAVDEPMQRAREALERSSDDLSRTTLPARLDRILGSVIEECLRLLAELDREGAHAAAYGG